jgi:hypothetical protein
MENPFQPNLRKPWLLLCITVLVTYSISPDGHATLFYKDGTSSFLEALMFLLSFPLGDSLMFLFHSESYGVTERFVFWSLAMGLGYFQWFHLFPALLRRKRPPEVTTLNLAAGGSVAFACKTPLGLEATETRPALDAERPPIPQFNDRGLTPLERVFRDGEAEG